MKLAFRSVISRTSVCSHSHLPTPHTPAQTFFVFENFSPAPLHRSSFSKVASKPSARLLPAHTQNPVLAFFPHTHNPK